MTCANGTLPIGEREQIYKRIKIRLEKRMPNMIEEIKTLQNERNQQILNKNQNLVDIVNRRRQNIQRIYHQNYLRKKAFIRKKYNNELPKIHSKLIQK